MLTSVEPAGILGCQQWKRDGSWGWQADAPTLHWDAWCSRSPKPPLHTLWPLGCSCREVHGGYLSAVIYLRLEQQGLQIIAHVSDQYSSVTSADAALMLQNFSLPLVWSVSAPLLWHSKLSGCLCTCGRLFLSQWLLASEYLRWLPAALIHVTLKCNFLTHSEISCTQTLLCN